MSDKIKRAMVISILWAMVIAITILVVGAVSEAYSDWVVWPLIISSSAFTGVGMAGIERMIMDALK